MRTFFGEIAIGPRGPALELVGYEDRHNILIIGLVQSCIATVYGDEMEFRIRCAKWLPWPRKIRRAINVNFSAQLGEGVGSWKGGVLGTGYAWKPGETMRQALRKMERAVLFSR